MFLYNFTCPGFPSDTNKLASKQHLVSLSGKISWILLPEVSTFEIRVSFLTSPLLLTVKL